MISEQQEIDDYVTTMYEGWKKGKENYDQSILGLASLLERNGYRIGDISSEIIHICNDLFKDERNLEWSSHKIVNPLETPWSSHKIVNVVLRDTRYRPCVNLKVYGSYTPMSSASEISKTAYIHEDVMTSLGLLDTDEDNIIEIETKSGKRTVAMF